MTNIQKWIKKQKKMKGQTKCVMFKTSRQSYARLVEQANRCGASNLSQFIRYRLGLLEEVKRKDTRLTGIRNVAFVVTQQQHINLVEQANRCGANSLSEFIRGRVEGNEKEKIYT